MVLQPQLKHQWFLFRITLCLTLFAISYLSVIRIEEALPGHFSDKFYHGLAFYALAFLTDYSFPKTGFIHKKYIPLFIYGISIEAVQFFLPYRSFSIADMVADAAGLALYALTSSALIILWPKTKKYLPGN